mgnify:CR=1 FL=1
MLSIHVANRKADTLIGRDYFTLNNIVMDSYLSLFIHVKALAKEGYIFVNDGHVVYLTEKGRRIARETYERHDTFCRLLIQLGVDEKTASADACEMEHAVSAESYEALKKMADHFNMDK